MDIVTLGGNARPGATQILAFRGRAGLGTADAVFIDLDAIVSEYADCIEEMGEEPLLDVRGSYDLLADARFWRDVLGQYVLSERIVVVGWSQTPSVRIHTIHDIVRFGVADLFPLAELRVDWSERGPQSLRSQCGEPFSEFIRQLVIPERSRHCVQISRGEVLIGMGDGSAAGIYRLFNSAHLLALPLAAGEGRAERMQKAIEWLGSTLCGARHSRFLPGWAARIALPREAELREELDSLEFEARELRNRIDQARLDLEALRGLKAIVGGSAAQAAAAANQRLRVLGANLLRDFEHEHAFVVGLERGVTILLAFSPERDSATIARICALRDRYRYEFDGDALPVLIVQPHSDGVQPCMKDREDAVRLRGARQFLELLVADSPSLTDRVLSFIDVETEAKNEPK